MKPTEMLEKMGKMTLSLDADFIDLDAMELEVGPLSGSSYG